MDPKLIKKLDERRNKGTLRSLRSFEGYTDLMSNDYLGLSSFNGPDQDYEGSGGSRLISGNREAIEDAETQLAAFFGYEAGLCFNSGYDANLGIFSSIPQKGDIVLYDEAIHASVRDGLRLSLSGSYSFRHNSPDDLERLLKKFVGKTIYIAVESLYSMKGDMAPLQDFSRLCDKYNARLIIDEAHAAGIFGKGGRGWSDECGVDNSVHLKLVTFGKAYGGHGAVVLCSGELKEYLINFARSFIYSTALPVREYARMTAVVRHAEQLQELRASLSSSIRFFREKVRPELLVSDERSPIQIVRFGEERELRKAEDGIHSDKLACKAIYPPTVSAGSACLRVCIHTFNTEEDLFRLASFLR